MDDIEKLVARLREAVADGSAGAAAGRNGNGNGNGDGDGDDEDRVLERRGIEHDVDVLERRVDDLMWYQRTSDVADLRQVTIVGPPPANDQRRREKPGNHVRIPTYVFTPHDAGPEPAPALVLAHGGVHANFDTMYANVVREMLAQGYVVIAPEYRGSTGYGKDHYELIDYGGLEVEDTYAAREWLVEHHDGVDAERIGVLGWSHGGLHALFNAFLHPEGYACAFAGVPVADLVARMGYTDQAYRDLYEADYHVGKAAWEDPDEYRDRSPAWHASKLEIPLRVHATRNDGDLNELEVDRLAEALRAHDKEFEFEFHDEAPGAHFFERIDTAFAKRSRERLYDFLARHLSPPGANPLEGWN
jgi:dipeptidyl aminopeptidase/acylaminoacyl peptidase